MQWVEMRRSQHLAPAAVILHTVDGQGQHFDAASAELGAKPGSSAQLCGAHRSEVSGVGEQDSPSRQKKRRRLVSWFVWVVLGSDSF